MSEQQAIPEAGGMRREQLDAWLAENCGAGLPHGEATDESGMLHALAYILRQIEGTNSYYAHIGQTNSATSGLRMALDHFATEALAARRREASTAELVEAFTECVKRLRTCAEFGGNSPEAVDGLCAQFDTALANARKGTGS